MDKKDIIQLYNAICYLGFWHKENNVKLYNYLMDKIEKGEPTPDTIKSLLDIMTAFSKMEV